MLHHKQEERKLKRIEGDIVKKQRLLRRVMHDYDNGEVKNIKKNNFKKQHLKFPLAS